jgi:hypothetical protein
LSIAGASAAYSLRRLGDYSGPAIRVRRSSDNAEQDIGFTTAGDLDLAALLAFVGVNSGFVTVWYDQSGFARNATQTTAALQPRIVNAGVVDTLNGRPSIYFSGTDLSNSTRLIAPTSGVVAQPFSISLVTQATPSACVFFFSPQVTLEGATSSIFLFAGSVLNVPGTLTSSPMVLGATYSGAGSSLRKDGAVAGSGNAGAAVPSSICIGARNDTLGRSINGQIPEMLVFPAGLSTADRQNLERSQSVYYGITYATTIPSGFVTTWYDQSGNVRHRTQTTAASQPRIVNAGVVETSGGRPTVLGGEMVGVDVPYALVTVVGAPVASNNWVSVLTGLPAGGRPILIEQNTNRAGNYRFAFGFSGSNWEDNEMAVFSATPTQVGKNGGDLVTTGQDAGSSFNNVNSMGQPFGRINEVIALAAFNTTDRQGLERNQGAYYNITVT